MVQSPKTQTFGEKSKDTNFEEKDLISSLPDAILCHILSLMPTKYAFRSSILSTRWKSLWTSVPIIDFNNCRGINKKDESPGGFMDFVDRVLLLHSLPSIDKFILRCGCGNENPYRLNSWICTAIKLHVRQLFLSFTMPTDVKLPQHLFTSTDLVVLKLSGNLRCRSPFMVSLPCLKVLRLIFLEFLDDGSLRNLISGCPVLEELEIYMSPRDNMNTLCICSSTLKKLFVYNEFNGTSAQCGVVIKAPSLETLKLRDNVSRVFEVDELPSLVKANFHVWVHGDEYEGSDHYCNGVVKMLAKASNVQHLRLANTTLKVVIHASAYNQLLFHSLTHLHMAIHDIPWSVVPDLLGHIPSLKVLVLTKDREFCKVCLWCGAPENVPKCLLLSLETIEFNGFFGCKEEMKLVQYLLENAMVLNKLTLQSRRRNKRIETDVLKYTRGSSACQIEFCHQ